MSLEKGLLGEPGNASPGPNGIDRVNSDGTETQLTEHISQNTQQNQIEENKYNNEDDMDLNPANAGNSVTLQSISDINNSLWRTPGDRELRHITHSDGTQEKLYFVPNKFYHKKLFVSFTVDNVDVDEMRESFRIKFYLQFNWIPSERDYRSLYEAAKAQTLIDWVPEWYPKLEFENVLQIHQMKWQPHPKIPEKGPFRLAQYKEWKKNKRSEVDKMYKSFDFERIKWICAELECDITFREELELMSFPFDVQDLSVLFRIKRCREDTMNYSIFTLPNFFNADVTTVTDSKYESLQMRRHPSMVGYIDSSHSQLDEWNVENCLIEFSFRKMVISIKLSRRWRPVLLNTLLIIFLMCLASFSVFSVEFEDTASRLELTMTLILTAVLFDTKSAPKAYLTYLDRYVLSSYVYLTAVMAENAICVFFDEKFHEFMFFVFIGIFVLMHVLFVVYAIVVRRREMRKVAMLYDDVKKFNHKYEMERKVFRLFENKLVEKGKNKYRKVLALHGEATEKEAD